MADASSESVFDLAMRGKRALDAAHDAHPNSLALDRLHRLLALVLERVGPEHLSGDEITALSGGTKPPSP